METGLFYFEVALTDGATSIGNCRHSIHNTFQKLST